MSPVEAYPPKKPHSKSGRNKSKLHRAAEETWMRVQAAMSKAAEADPKLLLYTAAATLTYFEAGIELKGTFVYDTKTNSGADPMFVATAVRDRLWISPWFPILMGNSLIGAVNGVVQKIGGGAFSFPTFEGLVAQWLMPSYLAALREQRGGDTNQLRICLQDCLNKFMREVLAGDPAAVPHFIACRNQCIANFGGTPGPVSWRLSTGERLLLQTMLAVLPLLAVEGLAQIVLALGQFVPKV